MDEILKRRRETEDRISILRDKLRPAEERLAGKACVYATGSFGRREAGQNSDLDVFILARNNGQLVRNGMEGSLLSELDAICVKADLIEAIRELGIPEFDGDGRYLVHYSVDELTKTLGTPEDDVTNTFTARLLLLLESHPLLGEDVFDTLIEDVIAPYWRDYEDHKSDFVPAFLANDILRLWRTFCVNYEARTQREPSEKKKRGKIKNYKLKHSRLLTCYSSLLYLLVVHRCRGSVAPGDVVAMRRSTPTERLEWLLSHDDLANAHDSVRDLLKQYDQFLKSAADEKELEKRLTDKQNGREYLESAYRFGDSMFETMNLIGETNRFYRLLVV